MAGARSRLSTSQSPRRRVIWRIFEVKHPQYIVFAVVVPGKSMLSTGDPRNRNRTEVFPPNRSKRLGEPRVRAQLSGKST